MEYKNWDLWNNITFKIKGYQKNFDILNNDESIITEYDGIISEIRIKEQKPPRIVGDFGVSVWNLDLGVLLDVNILKLMREHHTEDSYKELLNVITNNELDLTKYKKLVIIHNFLLHNDYRKTELTEEFIEMIYRDFYDENSLIIMLVKPIQNNKIDFDFYSHRKSINIRNTLKYHDDDEKISAAKYYNLNEFIKKSDTETNEYKLFAIANRCGFSRISDSHLFKFSPNQTISRIINKRNYIKKLKNNLNEN